MSNYSNSLASFLIDFHGNFSHETTKFCANSVGNPRYILQTIVKQVVCPAPNNKGFVCLNICEAKDSLAIFVPMKFNFIAIGDGLRHHAAIWRGTNSNVLVVRIVPSGIRGQC